MTAKEIKEALARAARKAWPSVAKASDLPFPAYWRNKVEWLTFHAPHIGDKMMHTLIEDAVHDAVLAEAAGKEPLCPPVPASVKKIWEDHAHSRPAQPASLTDSSNLATCGDGGRERTLISAVRQQPMKQGRLL